MAPRGSCPCRPPRRNVFSVDHVEDELARDQVPLEGSNFGSTSPGPASSRDSTPAPAPVLAPAPAPASSNELFKQFMKAYLESNQGPSQPPAKRERALKAKVPNVYYGKSHMDCYHFCQQCEDHFETARATGVNEPPLQLLFFVRASVYDGRSSSVVEVRK